MIKIDKGKIKNVMVNKAEDLTLIVRDCVSGVEIMNSRNVRVHILGMSPSISIDKSDEIHVVLNG